MVTIIEIVKKVGHDQLLVTEGQLMEMGAFTPDGSARLEVLQSSAATSVAGANAILEQAMALAQSGLNDTQVTTVILEENPRFRQELGPLINFSPVGSKLVNLAAAMAYQKPV